MVAPAPQSMARRLTWRVPGVVFIRLGGMVPLSTWQVCLCIQSAACPTERHEVVARFVRGLRGAHTDRASRRRRLRVRRSGMITLGDKTGLIGTISGSDIPMCASTLCSPYADSCIQEFYGNQWTAFDPRLQIPRAAKRVKNAGDDRTASGLGHAAARPPPPGVVTRAPLASEPGSIRARQASCRTG
jgi:hypothetical protein